MPTMDGRWNPLESELDTFSPYIDPSMSFGHSPFTFDQMSVSHFGIPVDIGETRLGSAAAFPERRDPSTIRISQDALTYSSELGSGPRQYLNTDAPMPPYPCEGQDLPPLSVARHEQKQELSNVGPGLSIRELSETDWSCSDVMGISVSRKAVCSTSRIDSSFSVKQPGRISAATAETSARASPALPGQLVFDAAMIPMTPKKLRKKSRTDLEASRILRKLGGACAKHKAARKAVSWTVAPSIMSDLALDPDCISVPLLCFYTPI